MRSVRRLRVVRLFALALVVWLAADTLSQGTCTHDLIAFACAGRSQVGDTATPHPRSPDRDDVNHCSCHWQYLPAASPVAVELRVVAPVISRPAAAVPPLARRSLERPPQGCA
jgi:hypothetical protein